MILKYMVEKNVDGQRLDDAIAGGFDALSKSEARRIIDRGGCAVNGSMVRVASRKMKSGDMIEIGVMEPGRFQELELSPQALIYEDGDMIAVNKPAGVNTQRTPYQLRGTLEYWVSEYFRRQAINEPARVIHRLDRGTSGLMLFPKNKGAAAWLSSLFHDGKVQKRYLALCNGVTDKREWFEDGAIGKVGSARYGIVAGGRSALTRFRVLEMKDRYALIEAYPQTGRTHQIRVHLTVSSLPIVGDATYGGEKSERMLLHCECLVLPGRDQKEICLHAPLDDLYQGWIDRCFSLLP